ncbi:ATP-binding cassette domain-containing protein [Allorhizobium taibaishanense]|uniref:ABC transporter ATP-binding protein n=1 Tax=Allorhizobium taibaishanense TaxID=887144 RepID=A0A1Q9A7J3_9HYPH|nr:sugar ABC transporter ATP-binding protein [Allorhizobium taibaishanense]MBB4008245.1 ribose transport system ATP-binding protein [Allorhizobium taibaishanense]OLP50555.1 ABC transporter ATP-binding protein [Allorhizobium taibaishanense]
MAADKLPLISVRNLQKSFGVTKVLRGVNFTVSAGQIHALLGGNGAGKSTMIRIITGGIRKDDGEISLSSQRDTEPKIAVVHQELALLADLSVAENIAIVHAASARSFVHARKQAEIGYKALSLIDPHLANTALHRRAADLSMHEGQIVEIARALSTGADVIMLDEPTANLTAGETERLFAVLRRLVTETNIGIVFVSHRMKEIRQLCDVCTIIRDGMTVIDAAPLESLTDVEIVHHMGQPDARNEIPARRKIDHADVGLVLKGPECAVPVLKGQILGLAGAPAGPSQVIALLNGTARSSTWVLEAEGWPERPMSPRQAVELGIGYVSGDRRSKGVLAQLPIIDNVLASRRVREGRVFVRRSERAECLDLVQALKLKAGSILDLPSTLSGGNQQKLLIARWLGMSLRLVVFEEPTRGVDIGTKRDIYELIRRMADAGTIVIWWSTENVELLELCDEILAFDTDGQAKGLLQSSQFNEDALADLTGMAA